MYYSPSIKDAQRTAFTFDGDALTAGQEPFTPSAGNLWSAPGIHAESWVTVDRLTKRAYQNRAVRAND